MVRLIVYLFLVLFCFSWFVPFQDVAPELEPYHDEFLHHIDQNCTSGNYFKPIQITIKIDESYKGNIGYCFSNKITRFEIVYNADYWHSSSEDDRYSTMMHELSHCYLGAKHSEDPNHFMFAYDHAMSKEEVRSQLVDLIKETCK